MLDLIMRLAAGHDGENEREPQVRSARWNIKQAITGTVEHRAGRI